MRIPLIDLKGQYEPLRSEIRESIDRVCDLQGFILGSEVAAFEAEIAAYCRTAWAVGLSSGTDALLAALMAIGISRGDEVITTPFTFFATAGAIVRLGGRPVFADIEPESMNLDPEEALERVTPRTRAFLPVHLFGRCARLDPLREGAQAQGLYVIEDAAQAIGSRDAQGRRAGALGDIGCFSFFPSKTLGAFGDGGLATTSDDALAERLRLIRVHGAKPKYIHRMIGGNFRLDAIQAAVLRVKLRSLDTWIEARRRNAARYRELFEGAGLLDRVQLPQDESGHSYSYYVVRAEQRDALRDHLSENGVATAIYYPLPLHLQECFNELGHRPEDFPEAEAAARECLALPMYPELNGEQQEYVVGQVQRFFEG